MGVPDYSGAIVTGALGTPMRLSQIVDAVVTPRQVKTIVSPGSTVAVAFGAFGDNAYRIMMDQDCALSVSGGTRGQMQIMRVLLQQPVAGDCVMSWPDSIEWTDKAPFVDSRVGSVMCIEIMWDGQSQYYGRLIYA